MLNDKVILITGGTGSFGKKFTKMTLENITQKIIIFSRDEMKQWEMASDLRKYDNIRFFIGDVRDKARLPGFTRSIVMPLRQKLFQLRNIIHLM